MRLLNSTKLPCCCSRPLQRRLPQVDLRWRRRLHFHVAARRKLDARDEGDRFGCSVSLSLIVCCHRLASQSANLPRRLRWSILASLTFLCSGAKRAPTCASPIDLVDGSLLSFADALAGAKMRQPDFSEVSSMASVVSFLSARWCVCRLPATLFLHCRNRRRQATHCSATHLSPAPVCSDACQGPGTAFGRGKHV